MRTLTDDSLAILREIDHDCRDEPTDDLGIPFDDEWARIQNEAADQRADEAAQTGDDGPSIEDMAAWWGGGRGMTPERRAEIEATAVAMSKASPEIYQGAIMCIRELLAEIDRKDAMFQFIAETANKSADEYEAGVTDPFRDSVPRVSCAATIRGFASVAWEGIELASNSRFSELVKPHD